MTVTNKYCKYNRVVLSSFGETDHLIIGIGLGLHLHVIYFQKLKKQRDQLKQYQKKINGVLEKDRQMAKKLLQEGKRDRAKLLLRKKKFQEGLLDKTDGQLDNLERLVHDLEFAQVEKQVLDGLKIGNEALKKANAMFSIEEIEQIMDDTAEAIAKQKEIDELLSGQLTQEDEDDVLRELDQLVEAEAEHQRELEAELPEVPTDELLPEPEIVPEAEKVRSKSKSHAKEKTKVAMEAS